MMNNSSNLFRNSYLGGSRVLSHILFWVIYYVTFSIIWANDGNYYASFGLELVLMPIRISVAYMVMYYLMPEFLLKDKVRRFALTLLVALLIAGFLQRLLIYFFYELFFDDQEGRLWEVSGIIRAMVLVNSTVLVLGAFKMYKYWLEERNKNLGEKQELIELRSDKRTYRISPNEILYVEGLGNYVTYYLSTRKPLISYSSLKEVEQGLPKNFVRIHKSFVVNKDFVESYTAENVEVHGRILPLGKSAVLAFE